MQSQFERYIPHQDIYLFNAGIARKAWQCFGCHYIPALDAHRFILWAPNAQAVSLVLGAEGEAMPMEKVDGGAWAVFVSRLEEGTVYRFLVTGSDGVSRMKADPFGRAFKKNDVQLSQVFSSDYLWHDREYMLSRRGKSYADRPMSVYEVHAGSWKRFTDNKPVYRCLGDELPGYCKHMGYTHVEFLPLTEHPFYGSWGYQVTGYFAPSSRYGSMDDFKYMVDCFHAAGIAVILDWVPAHFPKDEYGLISFDGTPLFERKDNSNGQQLQWGTLLFDYGSPQVQSFLISSACMFLEEYHIDGIRVDAVSAMLHIDSPQIYDDYNAKREEAVINPAAVDFLRKFNRSVRMLYPGVITVAEDSTAFPGVTRDSAEGGLGFCFKWDMGYMHDSLDYISAYPQLRPKLHNKLTFSMMYAFNENYVLAYSHDEVVYGKRAMITKMPGNYEQRFSSLRLLYALQFAHPGKKLCFMGNEFGQTGEWDHDGELSWALTERLSHSRLRDFYRELNRLYAEEAALWRVDCSWDGFKWLNPDDSENCAIAFMRSSLEDESHIVCAFNFKPQKLDKFVIGLPADGTLEPLLCSDDAHFGGSGLLNKLTVFSRKKDFREFPNSAELELPPLSAVMFRFIPARD